MIPLPSSITWMRRNMLLIDINVLINAHRESQPRHKEFRNWLEETVSSNQLFSIPSVVRSGFIRIVTNPKAFKDPTPLETALLFLENIRERENHVEVVAGNRHRPIFTDLCRKARAKGNLITDAYFAALAMEAVVIHSPPASRA